MLDLCGDSAYSDTNIECMGTGYVSGGIQYFKTDSVTANFQGLFRLKKKTDLYAFAYNLRCNILESAT